jgi:hypothetical protein
MANRRIAAVVVLLCACPRKDPPQTAETRDAATVRDAAALELAQAPLGLADISQFQWRKRGGQPAFRVARRAEARDDWPAVVESCKQALTTDPGHLEASWLLAVGFAKTGKTDQVLAPLQHAAAGDFGKWGDASLEQPALQPFLATADGQAWRRRVTQDREALVSALASSVVVTAAGDLYAVEPDHRRWHRLTRTYGGVVGAFASQRRIAYVARTRTKAGLRLAIGVVDLATGKATRPLDLGTIGPITVASAGKSFWIGSGTIWRQLDEDSKLQVLPLKTARPPGPWLEVAGKTARLHRLPVADVTADWDDQSLAGAIRIGRSNRVITVPSPGQIDGNTAVWAPDRAHLAFVAQLDAYCKPGAPGAAAFVVDASTGKLDELQRATRGLAIEWLADRRLAIAGDAGVSIVDLDGGAPITIDGATGLVSPRKRPKCTPPEADDEPPADDTESGEPDSADAGPHH